MRSNAKVLQLRPEFPVLVVAALSLAVYTQKMMFCAVISSSQPVSLTTSALPSLRLTGPSAMFQKPEVVKDTGWLLEINAQNIIFWVYTASESAATTKDWKLRS